MNNEQMLNNVPLELNTVTILQITRQLVHYQEKILRYEFENGILRYDDENCETMLQLTKRDVQLKIIFLNSILKMSTLGELMTTVDFVKKILTKLVELGVDTLEVYEECGDGMLNLMARTKHNDYQMWSKSVEYLEKKSQDIYSFLADMTREQLTNAIDRGGIQMSWNICKNPPGTVNQKQAVIQKELREMGHKGALSSKEQRDEAWEQVRKMTVEDRAVLRAQLINLR